MLSVNIDAEFGKSLLLSDNPKLAFYQMNNDNNELFIFIDGSKSACKSSVGTACFCPELHFSITKSLTLYASIFTAEAISISDALDIVLTNKSRNIAIFTDSFIVSIVQTLQSTSTSVKTNHYVFEIKRKILQLQCAFTENYNVSFVCINS